MSDPGLYHEFESEIEDIEDEGIIKPQEHWNAKHKFYKLLGYELVEAKEDIVNESSVLFENLDGDADIEYFIEGKLTFSAAGESVITCVPNGDNTHDYQMVSVFDGVYHVYGVERTSWRDTEYGLALMRTNWGVMAGKGKFSGTLDAISGQTREYEGKSNAFYGDRQMRLSYQGDWNNTDDNITTLLISRIPTQNNIDGTLLGTFSGYIRLWKRLPLE